MNIKPQKSIKQLFDPKKLTVAVNMISNTKEFLSDRLENDKNLAPSISVYSFFLSIHIFLLLAVLNHVDLQLESTFKFIISQVLIVFF